MRGNKTFTEHPMISKWQELGFTSKEVATKAISIVDPKNNKATCTKLLSSQSSTSFVKAFTSFAPDDSEEDLKIPASNSTSSSETNDNWNLQLFTIIPVLTSWTSCKPLPLNVTR
jgi:hypothetical protein